MGLWLTIYFFKRVSLGNVCDKIWVFWRVHPKIGGQKVGTWCVPLYVSTPGFAFLKAASLCEICCTRFKTCTKLEQAVYKCMQISC